MRRLVIIFFAILPLLSYAQEKEKPQELPLTRSELNRALNAVFNKLVAGNPSPGEIANYATLDPVNASFNIKGSFPIRKKEKQGLNQTDVDFVASRGGARISYLSFSVSGALLDKKYGALFSDSKLNAGISVAAQYNFGRKFSSFSYFEAEIEEIAQKRNALRRKYTNDLAAILDKTNYEAFQRKLYLLDLQQLSTRDKLSKKNQQHDLVQKTVDSLGDAISTRTGLADTLRLLEKEVNDLVMEVRTNQQTIDSIARLTPAVISGQAGLRRSDLRKKYMSDYDSVLSGITFQKFSTTWYTIAAEYGRKSYNSYDSTLPFAVQIQEGHKDDAYKTGFAINHLIQNKLRNRTWFFNGGASWIYASNLGRLTATTLEQRKQYTNDGKDTARSISTKYSVYTEPVESFGGLNLSAHGYYIFGKTPSGVHVFPSFDLQKSKKVFDCTFGYIIAFKNTVKDQPVVNTELYIRFNDIGNDAGKDSKFYNRNEIGLSFTLPFNILN
ncbi:hypothetical protein [Pseudobacter ginsenosidimutans]|uniref:Uncharacterized protein n=1 Tax=Pseudobacter ginsenosidimutans TaxID=661488 RepID=A0A4Q7MZF4_9BACT|nr:hypothetical protein [Pseudobacter ginsenosidimutans]QEC43287.1 hypothetical protein FSB84_16875 [Pseudobacter ginsenosidimutans]RZS74650.1 hypothetical protein EV199_0499 [Pseudobacter ginsenosidimutans]